MKLLNKSTGKKAASTNEHPAKNAVHCFIEGLKSDFASLATDQASLKEEWAENSLFDSASYDGLEDE